MGTAGYVAHREPWNKSKTVAQKAPFKLKDIWAVRVRLRMENRVRELAPFHLGIDSKLRGCDLVSLQVRDICHGDQVASRATVMQHKTQRPVPFEITPVTRDAVQEGIKLAGLKSDDFVLSSRIHNSPHLGTRQYARILEGWVEKLGLDPADHGTHSMRRTKATLTTNVQRTYAPCSCCWATPSWSRAFAISASRSTTPWRSLNRQRSEIGAPKVARPSNQDSRPGGLACSRFSTNDSFLARPETGALGHNLS